MRWKPVLLGCIVGVTGARAGAQPVRVGSEFQVNTYTTNVQFPGGVAVDGQGNFVVVWTSYGEEGSGYGVN